MHNKLFLALKNQHFCKYIKSDQEQKYIFILDSKYNTHRHEIDFLPEGISSVSIPSFISFLILWQLTIDSTGCPKKKGDLSLNAHSTP